MPNFHMISAMWQGLLKFGLGGLGISAVLIGCGLSLFGPEAVASFFNTAFGLEKLDGPITDLSTVNIDSELRFFGIMFAFYGGLLLWTLKDYAARSKTIPVLLLVFFLAGLARLIGYWSEGRPHLLFNVLMYMELGLPVLLGLFWFMDKGRLKAFQ